MFKDSLVSDCLNTVYAKKVNRTSTAPRCNGFGTNQEPYLPTKFPKYF